MPFGAVNIWVGVEGEQYLANSAKTELLVLGNGDQYETYVFFGVIEAIADIVEIRSIQTKLEG